MSVSARIDSDSPSFASFSFSHTTPSSSSTNFSRPRLKPRPGFPRKDSAFDYEAIRVVTDLEKLTMAGSPRAEEFETASQEADDGEVEVDKQAARPWLALRSRFSYDVDDDDSPQSPRGSRPSLPSLSSSFSDDRVRRSAFAFPGPPTSISDEPRRASSPALHSSHSSNLSRPLTEHSLRSSTTPSSSNLLSPVDTRSSSSRGHLDLRPQILPYRGSSWSGRARGSTGTAGTERSPLNSPVHSPASIPSSGRGGYSHNSSSFSSPLRPNTAHHTTYAPFIEFSPAVTHHDNDEFVRNDASSESRELPPLSDRDRRRLERKGVNPDLYVEMQAARRQSTTSGKRRWRWVGALVGGSFVL